MTLITRVNKVPNSAFTDLGSEALGAREEHWSAFGNADLTTNSLYGVIIFDAGALAGTSGVSVPLTGLTVGVASRVWVYVTSNSGSFGTPGVPLRIEVVGASTISGASFETNEPLFKVGAFTHTADQETATLRIVNDADVGVELVSATIAYAIYDEGQTTSLPYFDGSFPGASFEGAYERSESRWEKYDTGLADHPLAVVEFDAFPVRGADFILGRDALDDATVALIPSPRWLAIPQARHASIRRGRQSDDEDIDAGQATVVFDDYDGMFDPDNPSSPLRVAKDGPVMNASMPVRVSGLVQYLGSIVPIDLFRGTLEGVTIGRTYEPTVTVTARDRLASLNTADIPPQDPPNGAGTPTLWRAVWALGFAGIAARDVFASGGVSFGGGFDEGRPMIATPGGGNVGSHLREVSACEGGKVFVRADGVLHIGTHEDDFAYEPAATFTDDPDDSEDIEYDDIQTSTSVGRIINRAVITRGEAESGGKDAVTAQADESIARNGRVWSETVEIPLDDDDDAELIARWRATRRSKGATRVDSVAVDVLSQPDAARLLLSLDIAEVVRVRRQVWGRTIDGTYSTEGIEHDIEGGGKWAMSVYTSPLNITELYADQGKPFTLDLSSLDGLDVMAPF